MTEQNQRALRETLTEMPKIDLHRHLEGSLRLSTLAELARTYSLDVPAHTEDGLRPHVQISGAGGDFTDFLSKFPVLRKFYQSPEVIDRLVYEAVEDAADDNVRYLELRFNPVALAHARKFSLEDVTDWVIAAVQRAETDFDTQVRLIVTLNRREFDRAQKVLAVALDRMDEGIVGVDLAGDEANYPADPFARSFHDAREAELGITVHAGEWSGPETIRYAIEHLEADRIGHGVRVLEDSEITKLALDRGVAFEVCITSNVQSGVVSDVEHHPLPKLHQMELGTTINTDDPAVSDVTLTDEFEIACTQLDLGLDDVKKMIVTAAEHAFLPLDERNALADRFRRDLGLETV